MVSSMRLSRPASFQCAPRDLGPVLAHVAAPELAVGRQRLGDAERGVTGEGADLDRAPGADRPGQQADLLALMGRDLHAGARQRSRSPRAAGGFSALLAQPVGVDIVASAPSIFGQLFMRLSCWLGTPVSLGSRPLETEGFGERACQISRSRGAPSRSL